MDMHFLKCLPESVATDVFNSMYLLGPVTHLSLLADPADPTGRRVSSNSAAEVTIGVSSKDWLVEEQGAMSCCLAECGSQVSHDITDTLFVLETQFP